MKYSLLHLGCQMNPSDAERVRSVLESLGYQRTDIEEEADLLGMVACSVRQKAIDKVYARIHSWKAHTAAIGSRRWIPLTWQESSEHLRHTSS